MNFVLLYRLVGSCGDDYFLSRRMTLTLCRPSMVAFSFEKTTTVSEQLTG